MAPLTNKDVSVVMVRYGGGFISTLGSLYQTADVENAGRLERAFPEYFARYRQLAEAKARDVSDV